MRRLVPALLLPILLLPGITRAEDTAETLRNAKTLFFDRHYAEAREAWRKVAASGEGPESRAALYWTARCSEKLGESERALAEYDTYLDARPSDPTLREAAQTSRVALAAKLYKEGRPGNLDLIRRALEDPSRTVRYFAALQMASLGPEVGRPAIPVLKEILKRERDEDLVERAKLALFRLDPSALAEAVPHPRPRPAPGSGRASMIKVRIWEKGAKKPAVSINLPVALAEMVFKSLPDDARSELRSQGWDADRFWERVKKTGPTEILTIEGEDGERIQVWIE
jgi:tetratricopeptide (TPR) repeat protein